MSRLRSLPLFIATLLLTAGLAALPALAAETQTFTGKVTDTMCGAQHKEGIPPADCVRACVKHGAHYALLVGDKVYTLDTENQSQMNELNKLAWENARVKGTANSDTIAVTSVNAAK
jgi:hypothetical protein